MQYLIVHSDQSSQGAKLAMAHVTLKDDITITKEGKTYIHVSSNKRKTMS